MNKRKQKLRKYLAEQDMLWQILFGLFFLDRLGMRKEEFEFDIRDAVKFCNDEQDYETVYEIIDYLEFHEDEIAETLQNLRFKPISWQYDFIDRVSAFAGFNITQTLDDDALATAYGYALLVPQIDMQGLFKELDDKYAELFQSAAAKMQKLKRNFVLALECMLWQEDGTENMNFRELLHLYVPKAGIEEVIKAYKQALSPDVRLTKEEKECLAFAYYSPYFCDEIAIANGAMPEGSIFFCTETKLQEDKDFYARHRDFFEDDEDEYDVDDDDNDDDDYDEDEDTEPDTPEKSLYDRILANEDDATFKDSAPFNHLAVYIDPLRRCIIDSMLCNDAYANVYIEKFPMEKLNCTLPDFIRYHKGCLYTVEFADNVKETDIAQKLNHNLSAYEEEISRLKSELDNPELSLFERYQLEGKLSNAEDQLRDCYFIS